MIGCRLHQTNVPYLENSSPIPSSGLRANHELLLCGTFQIQSFCKVIPLEFLPMLLDSLVNHECGKCSINSNACITNKHTVLTNVFDVQVTVTAQQSPTSVSVFAQSSPPKSKNLLLFPTFLAFCGIIVDAKFRCSECTRLHLRVLQF